MTGAAAPTAAWLDADEPAPFVVLNPEGRSPFVLTCDHAGNRLPRRLGRLGLSPEDLQRHIAWDIGALQVAERLSRLLDAPLAATRYSRLVIDPNRRPGVPSSIAKVSEATMIPGNRDVSPEEAEARAAVFFHPYHDAIDALLAARDGRGQPSAYVAVHSFTPSYLGQARPWRIAFSYHRQPALAKLLLARFRRDAGLVVGENEPYAVSDDTDYGIPVHAERRGRPCVLVEIRQDQVAETAAAERWADRLAEALGAIGPDHPLFTGSTGPS